MQDAVFVKLEQKLSNCFILSFYVLSSLIDTFYVSTFISFFIFVTLSHIQANHTQAFP